MARTLVTATLTAPGMHCWPNVPAGPRAYLGHWHRHLFHFHVTVRVNHDDRDVEFHDLRDHIHTWLRTFPVLQADLTDFGGRSCEHLARDLCSHLTRLSLPVLRVSVSEDGEFTSTLETE